MNLYEDCVTKDFKICKKNNSIIVKAPTSSGKSFLALSVAYFYKKILYVCPTTPIIYQVGAHFTKMGYKVKYFADSVIINNSKDACIYIGDPNTIEEYLPILHVDFDYVVYDEIHNLNNIDGDKYENIISSQDLFLMNLHGINELQYDDYTQNTVFTVYGNSRFSDRRNLTLLNIREYTNQFPNEPTVDIYGNLRCKNRRIGVNTDGTFVTDNNMEAFRCEGNALITGKIQAIGGVSSLSDGRMKTNLKKTNLWKMNLKKMNLKN